MNKFTKNDLPNLNYGIIHSQVGHSDGVSIVMDQIEQVMNKHMNVPKSKIHYLGGRAKQKSRQITTHRIFWMKEQTNQKMIDLYQQGYGGDLSEEIEGKLAKATKIIEAWIKKKKLDVIIAHNTCHPVNFIMAVALHRYYRNAVKNNTKTPKYILWWHDSHLEREKFLNPPRDVAQYLLQGVPGHFVEYIIFINSLQFGFAEEYMQNLNVLQPGYYNSMLESHDVVYNTTDLFVNKYEDLSDGHFSERIEQFIQDFKLNEMLDNLKIGINETCFCLQHTRILDRKRIDFALKYCFELFSKSDYKAFYFLISGHRDDNTKIMLNRLHKQLSKQYNTNTFFLVFAEDNKLTQIKFEEYPRIFASLGGFSTYFSEIEGFGNNLLEVLASGLIPIVYTYEVFKKDIAKYNFKVVLLNQFEIDNEAIEKTLTILKHEELRKKWVNRNLKILKKHFNHEIIKIKLTRAIIRKRLHK